MTFFVYSAIGEEGPGLAIALFVLLYGFLAAPVFIAGGILSFIGRKNLKTKVLNARCQVCVYCFYDLSGRPFGSDTCPECGLYTPRRECVRLWAKLLRSRI